MLGIGGENFAGFYAVDEVLPEPATTPNNKKFVEAFKAKYGKDAVIGDVTQAAYLGPWLWKAAVEKAGSFDVDKVVAASPGIELKNAPEGYVKLHENHHLWSKTRIGHGAAGRPVQGGRRVAEPDRAESVPQGLPVSQRPRRRSASARVRREHRTSSVSATEPCHDRCPTCRNIGLMQGFAGLSLFCVLLLMALGLAIIFGQMGVINMAHGEFMTIGAYTIYLLLAR